MGTLSNRIQNAKDIFTDTVSDKRESISLVVLYSQI